MNINKLELVMSGHQETTITAGEAVESDDDIVVIPETAVCIRLGNDGGYRAALYSMRTEPVTRPRTSR